MVEGPVATALGTSASVIFVVSHVPQLWDMYRGAYVPSPTMFALQLVSGVIWSVYGAVQAVPTILVFGLLSTAFRILILGWTLCRKKKSTLVPTYVLAGGGSKVPWGAFSARVPWGTVVRVVPWAEADPTEARRKARDAVCNLRSVGCRATVLGEDDDARGHSALWLVGGDPAILARRLRGVDVVGCATRGVVGGTSAGPLALQRLGLLRFDVSVHGAPGGVSIDDGSALVLDGDSVVQVVGRVRFFRGMLP